MASKLTGPLSVVRACGGWRSALAGWWDSAPWMTPTKAEHRCVMGSPVHPAVHCRRMAMTRSMWCWKHDPGRPILEEW